MIDLVKLLTRTLPACFFMLAVAGPGLAQQSGGCKPFKATARLDKLTFHDHGEKGNSHGDRRILRWHLMHADSRARIGTAHVHSTVMHAETEGEHPMLVEGIFELDAGTIHATILAKSSDPSATDRSTDHEHEWAVRGGTGALAGVWGTLTTGPRGDGLYDVSFDISCRQ
jgi:hypothetical protein